ncbi:MAG: hypothetical protein N2035_06185 [Chthoniobacterales bacterium]|nr:hypothetical protein [Chthoniobacterales bacterium]MCX7713235.1 hypothetical protein [Chthoniobacterales bacterium]
MEISAHNAASALLPSLLASQRAANAARGSQEAQLREACRQFEAILWRSVLEKMTNSSINSSQQSSDIQNQYNFFLHTAIADAASGAPNSLGEILFRQLAKNLQKQKQVTTHQHQ